MDKEPPVFGCLLKMKRNTKDEGGRCRDNCKNCGWNQRVAAERKRELRAQFGTTPEKTEIRCPFCQGRIVL